MSKTSALANVKSLLRLGKSSESRTDAPATAERVSKKRGSVAGLSTDKELRRASTDSSSVSSKRRGSIGLNSMAWKSDATLDVVPSTKSETQPAPTVKASGLQSRRTSVSSQAPTVFEGMDGPPATATSPRLGAQALIDAFFPADSKFDGGKGFSAAHASPADMKLELMAKGQIALSSFQHEDATIRKRHSLGVGLKFKNPTSPQIQAAKKLSPTDRALASLFLEEHLLAGTQPPGMGREELKQAWLSLKQAQLRTHTVFQREAYQQSQQMTAFRTMGFSLLPFAIGSLSIPAGILQGLQERKQYERDPARPEYNDAFNGMMEMMAHPAIDDDMKMAVAQSMLDESIRAGNSIAADDRNTVLRAAFPGIPEKTSKIAAFFSSGVLAAPKKTEPDAPVEVDAQLRVIELALGSAETPGYRSRPFSERVDAHRIEMRQEALDKAQAKQDRKSRRTRAEPVTDAEKPGKGSSKT